MKRAFKSLVVATSLLAFLQASLLAQAPAPTAPATTTPASQPAFKPEELEQLVAPIALYPDALMAQILMASTYPLEVVMAARWVKANTQLKGDALKKEAEKQSWDETIKELVLFPTVLNMMSEKLDWTQKLGDAFLSQQKDVMDAAQRLRAKAQKSGTLKDSKELAIKTEPAAAGASVTQTIVIESKNPEVIYVPTYDPVTIYGPWPYPAYPPYYYYPPGYVPGAALFTFTAGVIVGSWISNGCNWGAGNVNVNVNRNTNINNINRNNINNGNRGGQRWEHNPDHRRGTGYRDTASQQKYSRRSDPQSMQSRENFRGRAEQGREQMAREGINNQRDLAGREIGGREGGREGGRDPGQTRDFGGGQGRDQGRNQGGAQQRDLGGGQSRDLGGGREGGRSSSSNAFGGGSGASARNSSSRGAASRGGGGGGARGGGGGGRGRR